MTIDSAEGATFPYAWYFRHLDAATSTSAADPPPTTDVVIVTEGGRALTLGARQRPSGCGRD